MVFLPLLGFLIMAMLLSGLAYQAIGVRRDRRQVPCPGRMVSAPGGKFHMNCAGEGEITVILESGISASSISWARVQSEVAQFARVCSYDRAGFGWSDRRKGPRTPDVLATELRLLLSAAEVPPPYVLVGHSFGGLIVRSYANQFPREVAGIVLVDALHPAEWSRPSPAQKRTLAGGILLSQVGALLCAVGFVRLCVDRAAAGNTTGPQKVLRAFGSQVALIVNRIVGELTKLPPELMPAVRASWTRPKSFLTQATYFHSLPRSSRELLESTLPAGLPLAVISADTPVKDRQEEQKQLARLCGDAEHIVAPDCGHWIHLDRPELVVGAIRRIVGLAMRRPETSERLS